MNENKPRSHPGFDHYTVVVQRDLFAAAAVREERAETIKNSSSCRYSLL